MMALQPGCDDLSQLQNSLPHLESANAKLLFYNNF